MTELFVEFKLVLSRPFCISQRGYWLICIISFLALVTYEYLDISQIWHCCMIIAMAQWLLLWYMNVAREHYLLLWHYILLQLISLNGVRNFVKYVIHVPDTIAVVHVAMDVVWVAMDVFFVLLWMLSMLLWMLSMFLWMLLRKCLYC